MAIYDTEEEQVEQFKRWWAVNQTSIIAGVFGAIALVLIMNYWQKSQLENRGLASLGYQATLNALEKNQLAEVEKNAGQLATNFGSSAYAHYAGLLMAKAEVEKGDLEAAKAILEKEIKKPDTQELQHIARLRLIALQLATQQYEQGLKLIAEVDPATMTGFAGSYDELQGDIYVAMDRLDEARTAYQSALRAGEASPLVQFKLDDIAAPSFLETLAK